MDITFPLAIDYDPQTERVYWVDSIASQIRSYLENGDDLQNVLTAPGKSNV